MIERIRADLEHLGRLFRGVVMSCEFELPNPHGVEIRWLHRSTAAVPESMLIDAAAELEWPEGRDDVFVHVEAREVRAVRKHLLVAGIHPRRVIDLSVLAARPHRRGWRQVKRG